MKVYSIFKKNLKTVSRNWNYFVVLFICPFLLILISGVMLNSNDFKNIRTGIVDHDSSYEFNTANVKNIRTYASLIDCLSDLTNSEISSCLYVKENEGTHNIDIYIDNTAKIIEYYSKQFFLENIVQEQSYLLEQTSEEINSKITIYSTSILGAKEELIEVKNELNEQERLLTNYRENLTQIRRDFNEVYYPLKEMQPEIKQIQRNLYDDKEKLRNNLTNFRTKKQQIEYQIFTLKIFLLNKLNQQDHNYTSQILDSITVDLNEIDSILSNIEKTQSDSRLIQLIDSLDLIISKLDAIKGTLDKLDVDLLTSIQRTRNSKNKVDYFILKLNEATNELKQFSKNVDSKKVITNFKKAFSIKEDPIFLAFPLLVSIIITFTSLVLSNMFILKQVNSPSYFREIISPTKDANFLIADYLINLFFVSIQAFVLFLIGLYWFEAPMNTLYIFIFAILLTSSIFIFIGMSLGYLIKTQSLSMLLTIFFVMLLLILSDLLAPSVLAGPIIKFFIDLNPFIILNKILVNSFILNKSFISSISELYRLGILLAVVILIAYIAKKVSKENIMQ